MTTATAGNTHRVRRIACETVYQRFPDDDEFSALRAEMDNFLASALPELLERTFSQYDVEGQVYYLKKLNLDIPLTFSGDRAMLKEQLLDECKKQLIEALSVLSWGDGFDRQSTQRAASGYAEMVVGRRADRERIEIAAFLYYLQYGFLTWKYRPYKPNLTAILARAISRGELQEEIRHLAKRNKHVVFRLISMLGRETDSRLFSWAALGQGEELFAFWNNMGEQLTDDRASQDAAPVCPEGMDFSELLLSIGPDVNIAAVMRQVMLRALFTIDHKRLTSSQLLGRLVKMLADSLDVEETTLWQWMNARFVVPSHQSPARTAKGHRRLGTKTDRSDRHNGDPADGDWVAGSPDDSEHSSLAGMAIDSESGQPPTVGGDHDQPGARDSALLDEIRRRSRILVTDDMAGRAAAERGAVFFEDHRLNPDTGRDNTEILGEERSGEEIATSFDTLQGIIAQCEHWLLQSTDVLRAQLTEVISSRRDIWTFGCALTDRQFVRLLRKVRNTDYRQLICLSAVIVELVADTFSKPDRVSRVGPALTGNALPGRSMGIGLVPPTPIEPTIYWLRYVVLAYWVLPEKCLLKVEDIYGVCQTLVDELSASTVLPTNTTAKSSTTDTQPTTAGRAPADERGKESLPLPHLKPITREQGDRWQQRLLGSLPGWRDAALREPVGDGDVEPSPADRRTRDRTVNRAALNRETLNQNTGPVRHHTVRVDGADDGVGGGIGSGVAETPGRSGQLLATLVKNFKAIAPLLKKACLSGGGLSNRPFESLLIQGDEPHRDRELVPGLPPLDLDEPIPVANAGLVLISAYLDRLFGALQWVENGVFTDEACAAKAAMLLGYVASGLRQVDEIDLALNKVLCGLSLDTYISTEMTFDDTVYEIVDSMLTAIISHWSALGGTSIDGLRGSFLLRNGWLRREQDQWRLSVESKPFDMLIDQLPWSYNLIKHSWMRIPLITEWRDKS